MPAHHAPGVHAEVLRLRAEKLSQSEIGRRMGLTKGQVAGILERAGMSGPAQGPRAVPPKPRKRGDDAPPPPGWPKRLRCLGPCGQWRTTYRASERMCGCHKGTRLYDPYEHAVAGRRR